MFNFFKKSVDNSKDAWKQGARLSGIDINLPFISISISPEDSEAQTNAPVGSQSTDQAEQPMLPRQELKFNIVKNESDELVQKNQLMVDYFFATPESFDGILPIFEEESWRRLEGSVQLVANEPLWIVGRFRNVSGKVLYKVPVGLKDLPFIDASTLGYISGYYNGSGENNWIKSAVAGITIETMNTNDCAYIHCFCRVPQNLQSNVKFRFASYLSNDDKGREMIEQDIVYRGFSDDHLENIILFPLLDEFFAKYYNLYNTENFEVIHKEFILPSKPYLTNYFDDNDEFRDKADETLKEIQSQREKTGRFVKYDKYHTWERAISGLYFDSPKGTWRIGFSVWNECHYSNPEPEEHYEYEIYDLVFTNNRTIYISVETALSRELRRNAPERKPAEPSRPSSVKKNERE